MLNGTLDTNLHTQSNHQPNLRLPPNTKRLFEIAWKKPPEGFIKVNFDGSKSSHHAAGGYALRDWMGHLIQAGAFYLGAASILVVEATAMRNGLRGCEGEIHQHIEGDNKNPHPSSARPYSTSLGDPSLGSRYSLLSSNV